jgi:hypothetical protein
MTIHKILEIQSKYVDELIYNNDPSLIVSTMSVYGVSASKAKKLIKRYKQKYQFDKCEFCGAYAVAMFGTGDVQLYGCDNKWEDVATWDGGRIKYIEDLYKDVYIYAHVCLACDELNDVFIEDPRDLVYCTSDKCQKDSLEYSSMLIRDGIRNSNNFGELVGYLNKWGFTI